MNVLSLMSSGLVSNQIDESLQYNDQTNIMVDSEVDIPSVEVKLPTREQHELANQALVAQRDIMYAIENLCSKLDDAEIYEYYL